MQVRCAGAVWLVSLVLYTGAHPRIVRLLPDIQDTLSQVRGAAVGWKTSRRGQQHPTRRFPPAQPGFAATLLPSRSRTVRGGFWAYGLSPAGSAIGGLLPHRSRRLGELLGSTHPNPTKPNTNQGAHPLRSCWGTATS